MPGQRCGRELIPAFARTLEAKPHSPVYTMHKYFARRPWNVFNELISHYTVPGEIVLDPFCGGGVTIVESLKLRRRAIGVDVNPLATYVTEMECRPLDLDLFWGSFQQLATKTREKIDSLYSTKCASCGADAVADWFEWDEQTNHIIRLKYDCSICGSSNEKLPTKHDFAVTSKIDRNFSKIVGQNHLWFPKTRIPRGDKTDSLLNQEMNYFFELFTKRNLLALSILHKKISELSQGEAKDFLRFTFSSSLKWAGRQSHLRNRIVEGWALHAYWIYPKSLEINVWNTFERRAHAVARGKRYSNQHISASCRLGESWEDLTVGNASCLIWNRSSAKLPMPDESVDAVITDPPYGGNVNYTELSDYWFIWESEGTTIQKEEEIIVNRSRRKGLVDYERQLTLVLEECHRVLKPDRCLVSTFNSKDARVVASFVIAASRAGFSLHPDGLLYQNPIRAYTTTFHAMQVGAFVGDFILTFIKGKTARKVVSDPTVELDIIKGSVSRLVSEVIEGGVTEPGLREKAYRMLIPFLARNANANLGSCRKAVDFFEQQIGKHESYFRSLTKEMVAIRRRRFSQKEKEG